MRIIGGIFIKVAICDASISGIETWKRLLCEIEEQNDNIFEVSEYTTCEMLMFHLEDPKSMPDLLLLDVKMPGLDGIAAAHKIREMQMHMEIIFLTSDSEHWPQAFDVDALHYLIREQATEDHIKQVIIKALQRIGERDKKYFSFTCAGQRRLIPIRQIRYFSVEDHITTVHYVNEDGKDSHFEFYTPIGKLENTVFNKGFIRTHKSYVVALSVIESISTYSGITLKNGTVLPSGRTYYKSAKETFDEYNRKNESA